MRRNPLDAFLPSKQKERWLKEQLKRKKLEARVNGNVTETPQEAPATKKPESSIQARPAAFNPEHWQKDAELRTRGDQQYKDN